MSNSHWNGNYEQDAARNAGLEHAQVVRANSRRLEKGMARFRKGGRVRFSNGVIGIVTAIARTSLKIKFSKHGLSQSYSPKMVEPID